MTICSTIEQAVQPVPPVADDRRAAGGRFEQADAGRPAGRDHVGAGDVQREALGVVEGRCLAGGRCSIRSTFSGQTIVAGYCGPATTNRPRPIAAPGSSNKASSVGWRSSLYVPRYRGPTRFALFRVYRFGIDRAVQGARQRRAVLVFQMRRGRAAGERQVQVVARISVRAEILDRRARAWRASPACRCHRRRVDARAVAVTHAPTSTPSGT